jgi:hypothetical protein
MIVIVKKDDTHHSACRELLKRTSIFGKNATMTEIKKLQRWMEVVCLVSLENELMKSPGGSLATGSLVHYQWLQ